MESSIAGIVVKGMGTAIDVLRKAFINSGKYNHSVFVFTAGGRAQAFENRNL